MRILGLGLGAELGAAIALELNGECFVPIHDHRGNVTTLLKDQSVCQTYRYTAFGEQQMPETITNPWQYASKRLDPETGFIYYGRRYYVPEIGRWVTSDPLGYQDGPNLYAFVHNNPMTHFDLYGLVDTESTTQKNTINQSENTDSSMWNWFKDKANAVKESVCDFANSTIDLGKDAYNYTRDSVVNIGVGAIDGGFYSLEHPIDCVTFQTNENPLSSHFVINQDRSCLTYRIGDAIGRGVGIAGQAVTFVETLGAGAVVAQGAKRVVMKQVAKFTVKQTLNKNVRKEIVLDAKKLSIQFVPKSSSGTPLPLPRNANGINIPSSTSSHTQIGWRNGRKGGYRQTRQWGDDGKEIKTTDWTDHGRPNDHTNPHDHMSIPNPTGGSSIYGSGIPFKIIQD